MKLGHTTTARNFRDQAHRFAAERTWFSLSDQTAHAALYGEARRLAAINSSGESPAVILVARSASHHDHMAMPPEAADDYTAAATVFGAPVVTIAPVSVPVPAVVPAGANANVDPLCACGRAHAEGGTHQTDCRDQRAYRSLDCLHCHLLGMLKTFERPLNGTSSPTAPI